MNWGFVHTVIKMNFNLVSIHDIFANLVIFCKILHELFCFTLRFTQYSFYSFFMKSFCLILKSLKKKFYNSVLNWANRIRFVFCLISLMASFICLLHPNFKKKWLIWTSGSQTWLHIGITWRICQPQSFWFIRFGVGHENLPF